MTTALQELEARIEELHKEGKTFSDIASLVFGLDLDDDALVGPGWYADDGNYPVWYPDAQSAHDAAQSYVTGADWGHDDGPPTCTIVCYAWRPTWRAERGTVRDVRHGHGCEQFTFDEVPTVAHPRSEVMRPYQCPECDQTRDADSTYTAPCVRCGRCGVCAPTAGGTGGSDMCEDCAAELDAHQRTDGTTMDTKSIAEQISARFHDDGQRFEDADGHELDQVCAEKAVRTDKRGDPIRYEFDDDSVIVIAGDGWDFGIPGCAGCYCWPAANRGQHALACQYHPDHNPTL
jgi:hypothetical protein